ncbi:MAG: hypothetical protein KUG77_04250 [Nannocystaceae bacterium]|nr:hypothetical protein [Nannocystaceae bacterium]
MTETTQSSAIRAILPNIGGLESSEGWGSAEEYRVFDNEDSYPSLEQVLGLAPEFETLRIQDMLDDDDFVALANAPVIQAVRFLDLRRHHRLPDDAFVRMLDTGKLEHIQLLGLDACYQLGDMTAQAVAKNLPNLHGIDIGSTSMGDAALETFASMKTLKCIVGMFMTDALTEEAVEALQEKRPDIEISLAW